MRRLLLAGIVAGLTGLPGSCDAAPTPRFITRVVRETLVVTRLVPREVTKVVERPVTVLATRRKLATHTPYRTQPPYPTAQRRATATPTPGRTPARHSPLAVLFRKPHYECYKRCLPDWDGVQRRCYRYFQFELGITNVSADWTVDWAWGPSRWTVTDGTHDRYVIRWFEWPKRSGGFYEKPKIGPGESATWTFVLPFIDRYEWVKAVEFQAWGHTYRQEFDIGPFRDNYNYKDCGAPHIPARPREGWSCPE